MRNLYKVTPGRVSQSEFALRSGNPKLGSSLLFCVVVFFFFRWGGGGFWGALEQKERNFRKGDSSGARATREGFLTEVGPEGFSYKEGSSNEVPNR